MDAAGIARILDEMGTILEIQGENPFRCRAYHNAARTLEGLPGDLNEMIADGSLASVPGIGETLHSKIVQLATTGRLPAYEALRAETPPGLLALLRVSGIGPKKIKVLRDELGIRGLDDLRAAAEAGRIAGLKGFGAKTEANILEGIGFLETAGNRIRLDEAAALAAPILEFVRGRSGVIRAELAGSLRRREETIGDIDVLFASANPAAVLEEFASLPGIARVFGRGATKASVLLPGFRADQFVQCDVRGVADDQFAFALHYFTGSKAHNIAMRKRALARGLTLNEYALASVADESRVTACRDEAELFAALGLAFVPPELRQDAGEIEAAEAGSLPILIEPGDLTGTFHCHSDWSDGEATLEQMAEGARARGLRYLGIGDHSRSLAMARGLTIERVREQWKAIDALNARYGGEFVVFKGTECDILADGSLDFPDDLLDGFDYVVASVHSRFKMSRAEMTDRIVKAVSHPRVTMLGHATGRLLLSRAPYEVDLDAVIQAAAEHQALIEINASPHRLDLDATHCRRARAKGAGIVINPDAHSVAGLDDLKFGVDVARRAWLTRADVFNAAPLAEVSARLEALRRRG